ncbi:hypothetical protein ACF3M1_02545 [Luteimonas sp. WGS1318]|uniref:hypothetical protein n=1 Tax=Luteimonas sp. WGS1318 TaxID=3366815 RepID=UPI00372D5939
MIDPRGMTLSQLIAELRELEERYPNARVQVIPGGREVAGVHYPLPVADADYHVIPLWAPPPQ